jgi:hypothetical protein
VAVYGALLVVIFFPRRCVAYGIEDLLARTRFIGRHLGLLNCIYGLARPEVFDFGPLATDGASAVGILFPGSHIADGVPETNADAKIFLELLVLMRQLISEYFFG